MNLCIAFVACNKNAARFAEDPSFIYRCENLAAGLKALGHQVWLGHVSALPWRRRFDAVVFHRPRATWRVRAVHAWLQRRSTLTLADVDDLVFAPDLAMHSPGVANGLVELGVTQRLFESHRRMLTEFSRITVSTLPLSALAAERFQHAEVAVLPNAIHWSWLNMKDAAVQRRTQAISYLPGTRSHDRDFASVAGALERVLARYPQARLNVTGPLDFRLNVRPGQVIHHAKLPFNRFHDNLRAASINLAPLEDTPFTRCKSAIKVMEAAYWNIPTVCSPLPDAERFVEAGACIAETEAEFEAVLEQLLSDPDFYQSQTRNLRSRAIPLADVHRNALSWLAFVFGGQFGVHPGDASD